MRWTTTPTINAALPSAKIAINNLADGVSFLHGLLPQINWFEDVESDAKTAFENIKKGVIFFYDLYERIGWLKDVEPTAKISTDSLEESTIFLYNLYQKIGWLDDISKEDISTRVKAAQETEARIIADGLNPKPHGRYRLFLIPSENRWVELHPTKMRPLLRDLLGQNNYEDWGWTNSEYYRTPDAPKTTLVVDGKELPIDHGFTLDDVGKIGFLVEDENAPGHNPDMPGSLLADMPWGEERNNAGADWQAKYPNTKPQFVNYAIKGLLNLGDINNWDDAFGRVGYTDCISQPFDVVRSLGPYVGVYSDEAEWDANCAGADPDCAAAAVVW